MKASTYSGFVTIFSLLLILVLTPVLLPGAASSLAEEKTDPSAESSARVPLLDGLYAPPFSITTDSQEARDYFQQGLVLTFGFDHSDAEASYLEAARIDPDCAMAYWGASFVLGPNINAPMNDADVPQAYARLQSALALSNRVTDKERALIEALSVRYEPKLVADRSPLDQAFAAAMGEVYEKFPDDPHVAVLYAESLMNLHPWNYWTEEGRAQPWTPAIRAILEDVIETHPSHPHGHHLYIHLMENSPTPEATIRSADLIRHLAPAAGHLVHMAGHGYYAAGFYHDCSTANEEAIKADKVLRASFDSRGLYRLGYMPHNRHFLLAAYMMQGRSRESIEAARALAGEVDKDAMRQPGLEGLQQFYLAPYYALVRFGRWDEILAEPAPDRDLKYPRGMWHYARGMALVHSGKTSSAERELATVRLLASDPEVGRVKILGLNNGAQLLQIATEVLAGDIAAARGDSDAALAHYARGVTLEDGLSYTEPPDWYYPVRQSLGALLMDLGRYQEAEAVFRRDLLENAENPWSLFGLARSLEAQGKKLQAEEAEKRFRRAWARADLVLERPVF
ncbi:MAG: hypothetical protein R2940_12090 [Syntrophotaleaceae bacterium]